IELRRKVRARRSRMLVPARAPDAAISAKNAPESCQICSIDLDRPCCRRVPRIETCTHLTLVSLVSREQAMRTEVLPVIRENRMCMREGHWLVDLTEV